MNNSLIYIGGYFALLPSILLAAFRNDEIGTDVLFYVVPIWTDAVSWADKIADLELKWRGIEKFYLCVNFLCGKVSTELPFLLFVLQSLILVPVFMAAIRLKRFVSPIFFMFVYFFTIYNDTFNMVRQSVALSMSLFAFSLLISGKRRNSYFCYFFAVVCHTSAIVGLIIPVVHFVLTEYKLSKKQINFMVISAFLLLGLLVLFAEPLMIFAMDKGLIDTKYVAYTSNDGMFAARISKSAVIYDVIVLLLSYYVFNKNKKNVYLTFFFVISLMSVLFEMAGFVTSYLSRIAKYPEIVSVFTIPYILKMITVNKMAGSKYLPMLMKAIIVVYWIFTFVISNTGEVYPYSSKILGI